MVDISLPYHVYNCHLLWCGSSTNILSDLHITSCHFYVLIIFSGTYPWKPHNTHLYVLLWDCLNSVCIFLHNIIGYFIIMYISIKWLHITSCHFYVLIIFSGTYPWKPHNTHLYVLLWDCLNSVCIFLHNIIGYVIIMYISIKWSGCFD